VSRLRYLAVNPHQAKVTEALAQIRDQLISEAEQAIES
jgi:hypothetical protein